MIFGRNIRNTLEQFACFSFHVALLVITLLSLKLHTKNSVCMLCVSVSFSSAALEMQIFVQ